MSDVNYKYLSTFILVFVHTRKKSICQANSINLIYTKVKSFQINSIYWMFVKGCLKLTTLYTYVWYNSLYNILNIYLVYKV